MFAPWCPTCRRRVLLGTRRIVRILGDQADGLELDLRCFCGTVVGSTSTEARPQPRTTETVASAVPAGPDASRPRSEGDLAPPPAAGDRPVHLAERANARCSAGSRREQERATAC